MDFWRGFWCCVGAVGRRVGRLFCSASPALDTFRMYLSLGHIFEGERSIFLQRGFAGGCAVVGI